MATATVDDLTVIRAPAGKTRQFAPVATVLLLVLFIAIAVLPSALNLPQSNPSTVLEYAPVPPNDNSHPPPASSGFSSLGIASTNSLTTSLGNNTKELTNKEKFNASRPCAGALQTVDPNSPQCQSFYPPDADNGGATYMGVTKQDITVVFYQQSVITTDGQRTETSPGDRTICDIEQLSCNGKKEDNPHVWLRVANAFLRYFNFHFQTWNRHVKAYFYWSQKVTETGRRSDAADIYAKLHPFAIMDQAWNGGFHEEFTDSAAARDMMVFSALVGSPRPRSFYESYAPLVWSYWPDVENWADMYSHYLCNKVAGTPVSSTNSGYSRGTPRKYGFYYTTDAGYTTYKLFYDMVSQKIANCPKGAIKADPRDIRTFPYAGWAVDTQGDQSYGETNVATWQGDGVNTIIWFGGAETKTSQAADSRGFSPDWIVAGDGLLDANAYGQAQGQKSWSNAWLMSYQLASGRRQDDPAYYAYTWAEPDGQDSLFAPGDYRPWFLLFSAIQTAGPNLNPDSVSAGLHAIQRKRSTSPVVAACYYFPGDYTCVKDGAEMYYDNAGITPGGSQGCNRLVFGGLRWPADQWGYYNTNYDSTHKDPGPTNGGQGSSNLKDPNRDPCGGYDAAQGVRPGTPGAPGS